LTRIKAGLGKAKMQASNFVFPDLAETHLKQLTIIRSLLLILLWGSVVASIWLPVVDLPVIPVFSILILFSVIHLLTYFRLKNSLKIINPEFFIQLLIDVILLNALFYFSGGANNPFISYLLVPICISAATLSWRYTWIITSLSILCYSLLMFFHRPLSVFEMHQHGSGFNWHIIGMWFNFFVSAILITYFVVRMANYLREREQLLNKMREDELRDEQLIAVATLAAGAAHEMNTPMATMKILLSELQATHQNDYQLMQDLKLLSQQVNLCAASLKKMVDDSNLANQGQLKEKEILEYCNNLVDLWQLMRPAAVFEKNISPEIQQQKIRYDSRLDNAILNCLNNAFEASPEKVVIDVQLQNNILIWRISDWGRGFSKDLQNHIGKKSITTKTQGLGLGLLLTHASIKRLGGSVRHEPNQPNGTVMVIELPFVASK
jgi:two-component system, sensor histidine kinase RegB